MMAISDRFETVRPQVENSESRQSGIVAHYPAVRRVRHFAASVTARLNRRGQRLDYTKISGGEGCFGTVGTAKCRNNGRNMGFDRRG